MLRELAAIPLGPTMPSRCCDKYSPLLPVFMLCRNDHLSGVDRVHFDIQHVNLLTWEDGKLAALTERLEARIVAVLGRGPYPRS